MGIFTYDLGFAVTIACEEGRFNDIILKLAPVIEKWTWLKDDIVFVNVPPATTVVWKNGKPTFAKTEAILISGSASTGGNFDTYQHWRYQLVKDFHEATAINTFAC